MSSLKLSRFVYSVKYLNYSCVIMNSASQGSLEAIKENGKPLFCLKVPGSNCSFIFAAYS